MGRLLYAIPVLVLACLLAGGERVVFTMRTPPTCPLLISGPAASSEFGFQSVAFRNESPKGIDAVNLRVAFATEAGEEVVEGGRILVHLAPGEERRVNVSLGRIDAVNRMAGASKHDLARAILFAESAEFSDGQEWTAGDLIDDQLIDDGPPKPMRPPK
jgi:hypothetical protein